LALITCLAGAPTARANGDGEDLVILLDRSGSMLGVESDSRGLATALTLYLVDQARLAGPGSRVAVVVFGNDVQVIPEQGLSPVGPELINAVGQLPAPVNSARTSMERALRKALELLQGSPEDRSRRVVLVSDGEPEPPLTAFPQLLAQAEQAAEGMTGERRKRAWAPFFAKAAQASQEQIEGALLPQFNEKGIPIIPVILGTGEAHAKLLRHVAAVTTGDPDQAVTVGANMILDLEETVHRPPAVMPVDRVDQAAGTTGFRRTVTIPANSDLAQFLVHYPAAANRGAWQGIEISLRSPDGIRYERGGPEYARALDRNNNPQEGTLVYERFAVPSPAAGEWEMVINSKDGRPLPPFEFLADVRTSMRVRLTIQPDVRAGEGTVEIAAQVVGADGQPVTFKEAVGEVATPDGRKLPLAFSSPGAGQIARATFRAAGVPPFGTHRVWVTARFSGGDRPYLQGEGRFETTPAQPVSLRIDIPADTGGGGVGRHVSLAPDAIAFETLGDVQLNHTIGPIRVETDSRKPVPVRLRLSPLIRGDGQGESPTRWLTLKPSQGTVQAGTPFSFHITATLPDFLAEDMDQEEMRGRLRVTSDLARSDLAVDVVLRVQLQRIKIQGTLGRSRLLSYALRYLIPGYQAHTIKLTTTAEASHAGVVKIGRPEPVSRTEGWLQPGQLNITIPTETAGTVQLPTVGETLRLPLRVEASRGAPRGRYRGEILVAGEHLIPAKLHYQIDLPRRTWQETILARFLMVAGALAALLALFTVLWRLANRFPAGRRLLIDSRILPEGEWDFRGRFQIRLQSEAGGNRTAWQLVPGSDPDIEVGGQNIGVRSVNLKRSQTIASGPYTLRVDRLDRETLTLQMSESPHRPARWRNLAMLTVLSICFLAVVRFWPAAVLQLLQR